MTLIIKKLMVKKLCKIPSCGGQHLIFVCVFYMSPLREKIVSLLDWDDFLFRVQTQKLKQLNLFSQSNPTFGEPNAKTISYIYADIRISGYGLLVIWGLTSARSHFDNDWSKLWHKNGVFDEVLGFLVLDIACVKRAPIALDIFYDELSNKVYVKYNYNDIFLE